MARLWCEQYWKRVDDDGAVLAVYHRVFRDGMWRMERFTYQGFWSDASFWFFRPVEDPDFVEIDEVEALALLPAVMARSSTPPTPE